MIIEHCGKKLKLKADVTVRQRCPLCKHVFTIKELVKARIDDKPPAPPAPSLADILGMGGPMPGPGGVNMADPSIIGPDLDAMTEDELVDMIMKGRQDPTKLKGGLE